MSRRDLELQKTKGAAGVVIEVGASGEEREGEGSVKKWAMKIIRGDEESSEVKETKSTDDGNKKKWRVKTE